MSSTIQPNIEVITREFVEGGSPVTVTLPAPVEATLTQVSVHIVPHEATKTYQLAGSVLYFAAPETNSRGQVVGNEWREFKKFEKIYIVEQDGHTKEVLPNNLDDLKTLFYTTIDLALQFQDRDKDLYVIKAKSYVDTHNYSTHPEVITRTFVEGGAPVTVTLPAAIVKPLTKVHIHIIPDEITKTYRLAASVLYFAAPETTPRGNVVGNEWREFKKFEKIYLVNQEGHAQELLPENLDDLKTFFFTVIERSPNFQDRDKDLYIIKV